MELFIWYRWFIQVNGLTVLANKGHIKYDKIDKSEITSMVT